MRTVRAPLLLLAMTTLAAAAPAAAQAPSRIVVEGHGEVSAAPGRAEILLAIETRAAEPQAAADENARRQASALDALRDAGVPDGAIATIGYGVQPEWEWHEGERSLIGYVASTTLRVRSEDLDRVGALIDAAIAAGVDQVRGISFELDDPEAVRREALAVAVRNARAAAEAMAAAAGGSLGELIELTTGDASSPEPMRMFRAQAAEAAPDTSIVVGEQTVTARVTGTWEFRSDS